MEEKSNTTEKILDKFYGGIRRDDKSRIVGSALNMEELDIFSNENWIQAEQIMSAETAVADSEWYAYDVSDDDTVYAYGKKVSDGKVRILKVTTGGVANPGNFATHITSADATNLAHAPSPIAYHKTTEALTTYVYFLTLATNTVKLCRLELSAGADFTEVGTLTGLNNANDRYFIKRRFGELFVGNGNLIAHVAKDGTFTNAKFTLPTGWEAVDLEIYSDIALILCRSSNPLLNKSMIYSWDLSAATQFTDSIEIPMGGPQWLSDLKGQIIVFCAINGKGQPFQLNGSFPLKIPGMEISNIATETQANPISAPKCVSKKDNILYFGLYKTDKTGIYAMGQLDETKSVAYLLSKRFSTTDYANHKPTALFIHGTNFYASFDDNGVASHCRCESANSPTRSSSAVYESLVDDNGLQQLNKTLTEVKLLTRPLPASTSLTLSIAKDYGSYTTFTRPDASNFTGTGEVMGNYKPSVKGKVHQVKLVWTSNGTDSAKLVGIYFKYIINPLSN